MDCMGKSQCSHWKFNLLERCTRFSERDDTEDGKFEIRSLNFSCPGAGCGGHGSSTDDNTWISGEKG